jgi:hypothetical protein
VRLLGLAVLIVLATLVRPARADQSPSSPAEQPRFQKGTIELSIVGGGSLPIDLARANPERHLFLASLAFGRVMVGGPGRGSFEWLVDVSPFVLVRQPDTVRGWSVSPLFLRWNFPPIHHTRIFAEASGSLLFTGAPVPPRTPTTFNFFEQVGFGVRVHESAGRAWLAGYRFQHLSNGGYLQPNPGANFHLVYGGISFLQ